MAMGRATRKMLPAFVAKISLVQPATNVQVVTTITPIAHVCIYFW